MPNTSTDTTIYVAGFVTDGGTGGFEWRYDRSEVQALQSQWIADGDSDVSDVNEVTLDQLALDGNHTAEAVTDALNAYAEAWEPTHGQNRTTPAPPRDES